MELIERFHQGGFFMYPILLFGILTVAFVSERLWALYVNLKDAPVEFRGKIRELIQKGDLAAAKEFARSSASQTAVGRIAEAACELRSQGRGEDEVQARMDEHLSREISNVDRRTGFLAMFGNVATLMGLLGTIVGMIRSFAAVAQANPADRATMLSQGISEAMNCTAFGLIVAIPALVAYAVFQNKTDRWVTEATETTTEIYNDLLFLMEFERLEPIQAKTAQMQTTEVSM